MGLFSRPNCSTMIENEHSLPGFQVVSGTVVIATPYTPRPQTVKMTVYHNNVDRFAVIQPDKAVCAKCLYVNLKNCCVEAPLLSKGCEVQIRTKDGEGECLTMQTKSPEEMKCFLDVLQVPKRDHSADRLAIPALPALEESEEEAE